MSRLQQWYEALLKCNVREDQHVLLEGCDADDRVFAALNYPLLLNLASFTKVHVSTDGTVEYTTAPVSVCLGTPDWSFANIKGPDFCVAWCPKSEPRNEWWQQVLQAGCPTTEAVKLPRLFGRLIFFKWFAPLHKLEREIWAEVCRWIYHKCVLRVSYDFSD